MNKKICIKCSLSRDIVNFIKKYDGKYGVRTICRSCEKIIRDTNNKDPVLVNIRKGYCAKYRNKNKRKPLYLLKASLRSRINEWCKDNLSTKRSKRTAEILGISFEYFKVYIENQFCSKMNWSNYGRYWEIDHIYPQSKLSFDSLEHPNFLECWKLDNLRPLTCEENRKKRDQIISLF